MSLVLLILANILLSLITESSNGDEVWFKRCYFGPVDIMKLRIKLLDEFGRTIDLNKSDYSFTLKIEQLYNMNIN